MPPGDLLDHVKVGAANRRNDKKVQARGMEPIYQGVSLPEIRSEPEVRRCLSIRKYRCHQHPIDESPSRRFLECDNVFGRAPTRLGNCAQGALRACLNFEDDPTKGDSIRLSR